MKFPMLHRVKRIQMGVGPGFAVIMFTLGLCPVWLRIDHFR